MPTDFVPGHFDTSTPHPLSQWISAAIDQDEAESGQDCGQAHPQFDVYHPDGHELSPHARLRIDGHRALLAEHAVAHAGTSYQHCIRCADHEDHDALRAPCRTVRILGAVYAHRDGYQEVWRP